MLDLQPGLDEVLRLVVLTFTVPHLSYLFRLEGM
jgi:hypothetical protein